MIVIPCPSSTWRATFLTLQKEFRQTAEKYPNLRHVIVQALDDKKPLPPSLEREMQIAGGWRAGEMRKRWESSETRSC